MELEIERILMEEILDENILEGARHVLYAGHPVQRLNPGQYNAYLKHAPLIEEAEAEDPLITHLWWHQLLRQDPPPPEPASTEDLRKTVEARIRLSGREWAVLRRIDPRLTIPGIIPYRSTDPKNDVLDIIARTQALAQAITGEYCDILADEVWAMGRNDHRSLRDNPEAWTEIQRGIMKEHGRGQRYACSPAPDPDGPPGEPRDLPLEVGLRRIWGLEAESECDELADEIKLVGDYLLELENADLPSGDREWEQVREAARWWKEQHRPHIEYDEEYMEREEARHDPFLEGRGPR